MSEIDWPATAEFWSNTFQVIAIAVGGWWTYTRFIRGRSDYARVDISHSVQSGLLLPEKRLIRVIVKVENVGNVEVEPPSMCVSVHRILPLDSSDPSILNKIKPEAPEKNWTIIKEVNIDPSDKEVNIDPSDKLVTLEPGEVERFPFDFIVPADVEVLQIHTVLPCGKNYGNDFWDETSIHRVADLESGGVL